MVELVAWGRQMLFFDNALDHARDLFAAGIPIVGVCASGILIRAVAPLLNDKTQEPPVVSVATMDRLLCRY
jgi:cobalt-precorrin 5A hydrolase/precorrin-3B C17-methyltransferase